MTQFWFNAITGAIFALVFLLHALRLLFCWEAVISGWIVPQWVSIAGLLIAGSLALLAWRLNRTTGMGGSTTGSSQGPSGAAPQFSADVVQKLLLSADRIFHDRINMFLVSEAIFLGAFVTLCNEPSSGTERIIVVISVLALLVTLVMWYAIDRMHTGLSWLIETYKKLEMSGAYRAFVDVGRVGLPSAVLFSWLPAVFAFFWACVLLCRYVAIQCPGK